MRVIDCSGPVACVIKFKDEAEALKIANSTVYGLAAAVHSNGASSVVVFCLLFC
jgi:acyl-CoA reductase-like NAD-dependent aldehyde dehydrogenase